MNGNFLWKRVDVPNLKTDWKTKTLAMLIPYSLFKNSHTPIKKGGQKYGVERHQGNEMGQCQYWLTIRLRPDD